MTANMISERTEKTNTELGAGPARPVPRHRASAISRRARPTEPRQRRWPGRTRSRSATARSSRRTCCVRQMDRDLDRFDQKKADDMTYYLYRGVTTLAGQEWRGAPPDPSR